MPLTNKNILVMGGGRGIGKAIALQCAKEGAKVFITARTESELVATQEEIQSLTSSEVVVMKCDITDTSSVSRVFERINQDSRELFGVIVASGTYGPMGSFLETDLVEWEQTFRVNVFGTAYAVQQSGRTFVKQGHGGRVILFSGGGEGALSNFSAYVSSKGAIGRFTETISEEFKEFDIFVNAIAPGAVNTKLLDDLLKAGPEKVGRTMYERSKKQKQTGGVSPDRAAQLVSYLLSERAHGLTGKTLSALWDPYEEFSDLSALSASSIFTFRRVIDVEGRTHVPK